MEKDELVTQIAQKAEISEAEAKKILEAFTDTIKEGLARGQKVTITGFGTFSLSKRKGLKFVNPKTNAVHEVPERFMPHFKPAREYDNFLSEKES